jgi:preprotein translocase subunit SecA
MISLEDDFLLTFGLKEELPKEYQTLHQEGPLKDPKIQSVINHIQLVIDGQNYEIKKTLNRYADLIEQQRSILFQKRSDVLCNILKPTILESRVPELHEQLCRALGKDKVDETEKYVLLVQIDKCWADYLDYVAYIKDGIHLESLSHKNPLDEYNRLIIQAFESLEEKIETAVVDIFFSMDVDQGEFDLHVPELKVPSATWTYIINDRFFQNRVNLF